MEVHAFRFNSLWGNAVRTCVYIVHFGLCYVAIFSCHLLTVDTDVIEETITENDLGCSVIESRSDEVCTSGDTDVQTTLQEVRGAIAWILKKP